MSSDVAIKVDNLGKCYHIYDTPRDRLKQFIVPRLQRWAGRRPVDHFREFWALRNVSFEVARGESMGIIGRNGSGKSTLLQLITGTLTPTTGSVATCGRIGALLELGSGFNPEFTGRENVFLNGAVLGISQERLLEKFDDIASFADIGDCLDQPVKTYSTGMLVRLAFAVQVELDPDVLIVDEALAVGDALFQKKCFLQLERLTSNGVSLLFVSHDQESVRTLTRQALMLVHGQPKALGVSSDVVLEYRRHLHEEEKRAASRNFRRLEGEANRKVQSVRQGAEEHSRLKSFGDLEAEIIDVKVTDGSGNPSNYFLIGENMRFQVTIRVNQPLSNLNVAFRIRNKEGIKITSWGTLNDDIRKKTLEAVTEGLFWDRCFAAGQEATVVFTCKCTLGANFYELQTTVTREPDFFYGAQQVLHWRDEAAFFRVAIREREYIVGGVCDLGFDYHVLESPHA